MRLDPTQAFMLRLDARRRLFPPGAACRTCGEDHPFALLEGRRPVICYECDREAWGVSRTEEHHLGGCRSCPAVLIPGNLHRVLSVWQKVLWRGRFRPGSPEAVALDTFVLLVAIFASSQRELAQ